MESVAFRTQARTVDHLGREQIADCPTAISELWKNAYDAYARNVALHIFDGEQPVAAIYDDGHGMSYDQFVQRWLTVGTESKFQNSDSDVSDRLGLKQRPKQGQKGIGRLSSANLGPLLLVVSKRKESDFVAALIDWRVFENPYLVLSDVMIPVVAFKQTTDLKAHLPDLFDRLMENVWGNPEQSERSQRLTSSWDAYDKLRLAENPDGEKPSEAIARTIIDSSFTDRHLEQWSVWSGDSDHGTALLVSQINLDLQSQIPGQVEDALSDTYRAQFEQTLSQFTDPYIGETATGINEVDPDFAYKVVAWEGDVPTIRISKDDAFGRDTTDQMEHVIEGRIDETGIFSGQVKAFGEWRKIGTQYQIMPPKDLSLPKRRDTKVGPVDIYIATFEQERANTTHSSEDWERLSNFSGTRSGLMVFRNGLRVLPYGRVDNDFFEIEQRRSRNAGREYWNARRMYGRIALSRQQNPNLIDKAGREGFIDNKAARTLKALVMHVLMQAARDYFGSASDIRAPIVETQQEKYREQKLEEERKKVTKRNNRKFRQRLKANLPLASDMLQQIEDRIGNLDTNDLTSVMAERKALDALQSDFSNLRIPGPPRNLSSLEDDYREFRSILEQGRKQLEHAFQALSERISELKPADPREVFESEIRRAAAQIHAKTAGWRKEINALQNTENERIKTVFDERNKLLHEQAAPLLIEIERQPHLLAEKLEQLDNIRRDISEGNEEIFPSYIAALELLNENVDLELISNEGVAAFFEQQEQISRLNSSAQLGIAVEILDHEMAGYMHTLRAGLQRLSDMEPCATIAKPMQSAFSGLNRQLEFISPLRFSGDQTPERLTGAEITEFLKDFFATVLRNREISLQATAEFERFSVYDLRSRLYPVFVNLINNSVYWLQTTQTNDPKIIIDIRDEEVIIADNGPGIDPSDVSSLFQLFFTRKLSGGRGIGLYLARANLRAAGHSIEYVVDKEREVLSGANFAIKFRGAEF